LGKKLFQKLEKLKKKHKLERTIASYILEVKSRVDIRKELRAEFKRISQNNDRILSYSEIKEGYIKVFGEEMAERELELHVNREGVEFDKDSIDFEELINPAETRMSELPLDKFYVNEYEICSIDRNTTLPIDYIKYIKIAGIMKDKILDGLINEIQISKENNITFGKLKDIVEKVYSK